MASIKEIKQQICGRFCKHPEYWDEEKMGYPLSESYICTHCPLDNLRGEDFVKTADKIDYMIDTICELGNGCTEEDIKREHEILFEIRDWLYEVGGWDGSGPYEPEQNGERVQVVIDIPQNVYEASKLMYARHDGLIQIPLECIAKGVVLPEHHGRLIDAGEAVEKIRAMQDSLMSGIDTIWDRNKGRYKGMAYANQIILEETQTLLKPTDEAKTYKERIKNGEPI